MEAGRRSRRGHGLFLRETPTRKRPPRGRNRRYFFGSSLGGLSGEYCIKVQSSQTKGSARSERRSLCLPPNKKRLPIRRRPRILYGYYYYANTIQKSIAPPSHTLHRPPPSRYSTKSALGRKSPGRKSAPARDSGWTPCTKKAAFRTSSSSHRVLTTA